MTLGTMLARMYRRTGYASTPASDVTTRFTDHLNEVLDELISDPGIGPYLSLDVPPLTFASVADQQVYALKTDRIDAITERTNDRKLEMQSLSWYREVQPDPTDNTGTPTVWVPLGFSAVSSQPSTASKLYVDSSSASDTGTAYLEGIRTGGIPTTLSVLMTGTTAVTFSSTITDIIEVTKFYLSTAAVGTVTLQEATGDTGDTLATIGIGETFSRYLRIALWPTPAGAITYYADAERELPLMSNTNDEPPIARRFHRVLVDGALWKEWDKKDDTRAATAFRVYDAGKKQLRYFLTCPPDYLPTRGFAQVARSRLGGQFPGTNW